MTSLPDTLAGLAQLEQILRSFWAIENRLPHARDETLGAGRWQVHSGIAAPALAASCNAVVPALRFHIWSSRVAATRCYAARPQRSLPFLGAPAP